MKTVGGRQGLRSLLTVSSLWLVCGIAMLFRTPAFSQGTGTEVVLRNFGNVPPPNVGYGPYAGVILAPDGALYGTTVYGGKANAGVVYRVEMAGKERVLYNFTGGVDGGNPYTGVVRDAAGNLYGTTPAGGTSNQGTIYKIDLSGRETVLHSFTGGIDGGQPMAGVIVHGTKGNTVRLSMGG